MYWNRLIAIVLVVKGCNGGVGNETKVMAHISETIGGYVLGCRKEISFGANIIDEFLSYWDDRKPLENPNMGCVVKCVLDKLHLITPGGELEVANAEAFAKANGSDDRTSKALIQLYQMCKTVTKMAEPCRFGLDISRCFRAGVLMLDWAPDSDNPTVDYIQEDQ